MPVTHGDVAPKSTHVRGRVAEESALDYLIGCGYRILERNYRCSLGELDLVAEDAQGVLCFVEVRSRATTERGTALETIGPAKQRRIIRLARHYLGSRAISASRRMRFDVVGITLGEGKAPRAIELICDAFDAPGSFV